MDSVSNEFAPIKFELIEETLQKPFTYYFPKYNNGLIKILPDGYVQNPSFAANRTATLYCLKPRPDDVWLRTFPRSGKFLINSF